MKTNPVQMYRNAAMKLYGISEHEAATAIYSPSEDNGEWAPGSMAIINLETGHLPLSYYNNNFIDECFRLSDKAGVGYVECVNAAICAVYN